MTFPENDIIRTGAHLGQLSTVITQAAPKTKPTNKQKTTDTEEVITIAYTAQVKLWATLDLTQGNLIGHKGANF